MTIPKYTKTPPKQSKLYDVWRTLSPDIFVPRRFLLSRLEDQGINFPSDKCFHSMVTQLFRMGLVERRALPGHRYSFEWRRLPALPSDPH